MPSMERQLIFDVKELRQIGVECAKCKTVAVFSIDNERPPVLCPSCEKPFYESTQDSQNPILRLRAALIAVSASTHRFTARVPISPTDICA